jgi:hypothetical protein
MTRHYMMSIKKTNDSVSAFQKNSESNVCAALVDLKGTLENLRKISGDIGAVMENVSRYPTSVASVEGSIWGLCDQLRVIHEKLAPWSYP